HQRDEPAADVAPEAPQLLLVGTETRGDTESERAYRLGLALELNRAADDGDAVVPKGGIGKVTFAAREQPAEVAVESRGGRWRPAERISAYTPERGVSRRGSRVRGAGA